MRHKDLLAFVDRAVIPFFPGAIVRKRRRRITRRSRPKHAVGSGCTSVMYRAESRAATELEVYRSHRFSSDELRLLKAVPDVAAHYERGLKLGYQDELYAAARRQLVVEAVHGAGAIASAKRIFQSALAKLETLAASSYEGQRVALAIGLHGRRNRPGPELLSLLDEDYAPLLANGVDTLMAAGANGCVYYWGALEPGESHTAPFRFSALAAWTKHAERVAAALTRAGDLLVFSAGALKFAKRRGVWLAFPHQSAMTALGSFPREVKAAVYASCLDASFARHGACIAIVRTSTLDAAKGILDDDDLVETSDRPRARLCREVLARPFHEIPRETRLALLSMDGATLIGRDGDLIAAGAIVQSEGISGRGARHAAAVRLAEFGVAAKVSQDGRIQVWKEKGVVTEGVKDPPPAFSFG